MQLFDEIKNCSKCHLRQMMPLGCRPVPGVGPLDAKLMIVGEALGGKEAIMEEPFVGLCGLFLNKMLNDAGIERDKCYITNTVKCHPYEQVGKYQKCRPPTNHEIRKCDTWLLREIDMIKPSYIVTLGKIATDTLFNWAGLSVSGALKSKIGNRYNCVGAKVMPLYHPSYLMQRGKDYVNETIVHLIHLKKEIDKI